MEIIFILLKAGMKAGSHLWSLRRSSTARVVWWAVAFIEIIFILLKAGMKAGSHLWSVRRSSTARAV
jgi:hypothetical protein